MRLGNYIRIRKEDYPEELHETIDTLSNTLNNALEQVFFTLHNRTNLKDNIYCKVKEIDITVDSNGVPTIETTIRKEIDGKVEGIEVIQQTNLTDSSVYPTAGIFISFTETQNGILINHIAGLPANNTFKLKIIIWF